MTGRKDEPMMFYVAHRDNDDVEKADVMRSLCIDLQKNDSDNVYWSPLVAFGEGRFDTELCMQFICACDALIVASAPNDTIKQEIRCAKEHEVPVLYLPKISKQLGQTQPKT